MVKKYIIIGGSASYIYVSFERSVNANKRSQKAVSSAFLVFWNIRIYRFLASVLMMGAPLLVVNWSDLYD